MSAGDHINSTNQSVHPSITPPIYLQQTPTGQPVTSNYKLVSANGKYMLCLQQDGNLVGRDLTTNQAFWASNTSSNQSGNLTLQFYGGNDSNDGKPWISGANLNYFFGNANQRQGTPSQQINSYLIMQDDRNIVVYGQYNGHQVATWATNTNV